MTRALAIAAAALVALLVAAPAPTDAKPRRTQIVCFRHTTVKGARTVRRTVCRPRRRPAAAPQPVVVGGATSPAPAAAPAPAPASALPVATPGPGATGAPLAPPLAPGAPVAAPSCVPEDTEWLAATAADVDQAFKLLVTRTCLRAGRTIVQLRNTDAQDHDLYVAAVAPGAAKRVVIPRVAPGTMQQADVDLTPGTWRFFCDLPGHESMTRTVTVTSG